MLPVLLVIDALGLKALWRERDAALLRLLVPAGLVGTVVGTLLFGLLSAKTVAAIVGGITLAFLLLRTVFPPRADAPRPPRVVGFFFGVVSGFTSFVAHAGGPPVGFYMLPLKLSPLRFTATLAVFFAVINTSKWIPYAALGLIDWTNMATAAVLLPVAPVGVWLGLRVVRSRLTKSSTSKVMPSRAPSACSRLASAGPVIGAGTGCGCAAQGRATASQPASSTPANRGVPRKVRGRFTAPPAPTDRRRSGAWGARRARCGPGRPRRR